MWKTDKILVLLLFILVVMSPQISIASTINVSFNNLDEKLLSIQPFTSTIGSVTTDLLITNNTGDDWTDFHFRTGGGNFLVDDFSTDAGGDVAFNNQIVILGNDLAQSIDITNLNILDGNSFSAHLSNYCAGEACKLLPASVYGFPTIDGTSSKAPEPATLALVGLGLAGLGVVRNRKAG